MPSNWCQKRYHISQRLRFKVRQALFIDADWGAGWTIWGRLLWTCTRHPALHLWIK